MIPLRTIPTITAWCLPRQPLRIQVSRDPVPSPTPAAAGRWAELCSANPNYFDGPILSVVTFDEQTGDILCRRDSYQRLAVQPQVPTGVQQLSVTGVLTASDAMDRRHCLLGRRSPKTRIFGGMWELGPSGGLPPPPVAITELSAEAVLHHLADEVSEEVGLTITRGEPVAFVRDHAAQSDDICLQCDLGSLESLNLSGPANWEYIEVLWLPLDTVSHFDRANIDEIIPATRALFRVLGWIDES